MLLLFDFLNKQKEFDEEEIEKKIPSIKSEQLSNLKAYLYEKILQAIRQYNSGKIQDIQIREQIDFAQLLFDRRLYQQGIKCLKKARKLAQAYDNLELQLEIIKMEKGILMHTIDNDTVQKVDTIIKEVSTLNKRINNINVYSNLSMKLSSFYTRIGFIRDEQDFNSVREFFSATMPIENEEPLSTIEKVFLFRLYVGYYFFIQDFKNGYEYARRLVNIYETEPDRIKTNTEEYIISLNNLLIAQFKLNKYAEFVETNKQLQAISDLNSVYINESTRIRLLKYYYIHEINRYFLTGEFSKGIESIVDNKDSQLLSLVDLLDKHSSLILKYKIACLYFGASNFNQSLKWLNKIINIPNVDIREDLHCFARIINLVCHYELGNYDVIKYYIISTYRFLWKKDDLHLFQKYILKFLKALTDELSEKELVERFKKLKLQLLPLMSSPYDKRAFIYFDIISWLESKIERRTVQEVIREKALKSLDSAA
jgi:hypothetical protein